MVQFREEQRFEWYWTVLVFLPALLVGFGLYRQVAAGALLWPALAVALFVAVWFMRMKLVTEVRDDGLYICFVWLWPERLIPWDQIRSVDDRTYRPVRDFGGWGVRWAARGIVYHARGNHGARMVLASGERILVGSQRTPELVSAVAAHIPR